MSGLTGADGIVAVDTGGDGVTTFNTRTGAVTLSKADVTGALTYTPVKAVIAGTNITVDATDPANPIVAASGGGGSPPFDLSGGDTFTATASGPGDYTLAKSAIVIKNGDGDEVCRIWATDPDANNFNEGNLYIGYNAGLAQPTDNVSAGFENVGVGYASLLSNSTGSFNTGVGFVALRGNVTGLSNVGVGSYALVHNVSGDNNTAVGEESGPGESDADLSNTTTIGFQTTVTASNRTVIGNADATDVYFGSETAASILHGKADALVFPDSDPHVAGAAYWVAGVLTKSAG